MSTPSAPTHSLYNGLVIVGDTPTRDEHWVPYLCRKGEATLLPLFPVYVQEISKSKDEALGRAKAFLDANPGYKLRWRGSWVVVMNFRDRLTIDAGTGEVA